MPAKSPGTPSVQLKCVLLNAENLFLLSDQKINSEHLKLDPIQWAKLSTSIYENKPLEKLFALQKLLDEINPDLIFLVEVGGSESLQNFNRLFLQEKYSPALIEGNSNRNIDVGFLIRKNLGFYFDINTNKNRPINYLYPHEKQSLEAGLPLKNLKSGTSHKFSRDAAELHLFQNDREKPFCIFVLAHLKSRLDPDGIDQNGFERRQAEMKTLLEIYQELETKFGSQVPIALLGDFNGNASPRNTDKEFKALYETTGLKDVCDLSGLDEKKSATFVQVNRNSAPEGKQLDYCFLSKLMQNYLDKTSVQVYRYRGPLGMSLDIPTRLEEKLSLPSDHYPIVFTLKGLPLR
jgi:hypothetical protein